MAPQWPRDMTLVGTCALFGSRNHLVGRLRDVAFAVCRARSSVRNRLIGGPGLSGKTPLLLSSVTGSMRTHLCLDVLLRGQLGLQHSRSSLFLADVVELPLELLERRSIRNRWLSLRAAAFYST